MSGSAPEHPLEIEEAQGWVGFKLDDVGGASAGRVEAVFVDAESGEPVWLVVRMGRFGRRTAIPFELAAGGVDRVWAPFEKGAIKNAPEVDPGAGLDRDRELELCDHYGLPAAAARRKALEGREGAERTAIPA